MKDWHETYLPFIKAAVTASRLGGDVRENINNALQKTNFDGPNLNEAEYKQAISQLIDDGYISGETLYDGRGIWAFNFKGVSGKAFREAGVWPDENAIYRGLIETLEEELVNAESEDDKSKIKKLIKSMTSIGQEFMVKVVAEVIDKKTGG